MFNHLLPCLFLYCPGNGVSKGVEEMNETEIDTYPTEKQMKAIQKLEAALKECKKENVVFHVVLETVHTFNGNYVSSIDDEKRDDGVYIPHVRNYTFSAPRDMQSWADDAHYVHFKKVKK